MNKCPRIQEALEASGLSTRGYLKKFALKDLHDDVVRALLESPNNEGIEKIQKIIPLQDDFVKFAETFRKLSIEQPPQQHLRPTGISKAFGKVISSIQSKVKPTDVKNDSLSPKLPKDANFTGKTTDPNKKQSNKVSPQETTTTLPDDKVITGPVQIIDIPYTYKSEDSTLLKFKLKKETLVLKKESLGLILSKVANRPVALLSIAGPSRQGKSFILTYMLKYLRSLSINKGVPDPDWIGRNGLESKREESLANGFKWRSGVERETLGIWMWPQPFTLRRKDGLEFDVLLMDTQGVFDAYTEKKDWATIVGLSLLTSSCLIFNIMTSLQEDSLLTLKDFMDFGLMAKSSPSNPEEKPFQKLVFLIRDWPNSDEYPYGAKGGADYLDWNLAQHYSKLGSEVRKQINQCFDRQDCYLMPEPGSAVKSNVYDGSVAKMDPGFAEHIQLFIEHLFDTSNSRFPPKTLSGNLVTGQDLLLHFEQFVRVFNSDQMPSAHDLNQATVLICNQGIVNKCTLTYRTEVEHAEKTRPRGFWLEDELNNIHTKAYNKSMEVFETSRKMGPPDEVEKFKKDFIKYCKDYREGAVASNANSRTDYLHKAEEDLHSFLQKSFTEKFIKECKGQDDFVEEETFKKIYEECYNAATEMLEKCLALPSLKMLTTAETNRLEKVTLTLKESLQQSNKMKKSEALNNLRVAITDLTGKFKLNIDSSIQNSKYWNVKELKKLEGVLIDQNMKELCKEYMNSALLPSAKQQLSDSIQREYTETEKRVELRNKNFLVECEKAVIDLGNIYMEMIEKDPLKGKMTEIHSAAHTYCIKWLKEFEGFDKLPLDKANILIQDLNSCLSERCFILVEKWSPRKKQQLLKRYKDRMNEAYNSGNNINGQGQLDNKHNLEKKYVLDSFKEFLDGLRVSEDIQKKILSASTGMQTDFETEIENHMDIIREKEKLRQDALRGDINGYLSRAKTKYLKLSKSLNDACHDEETFKKRHHESKTQVKNFFNEVCVEKFGADAGLDKYISELETYMESIAQFKTIENGKILEITGVSLQLSQEMGVVDNMCDSNASIMEQIKQVRWIASKEIILNENLCGDFWSGTSLVFYSKLISVEGNERLIDVSGWKGRSVEEMEKPSTSTKSGMNGQRGKDGKPGGSGGNIQIIAETIVNANNLRLTSNGGCGGKGGPGGNGSDGIDGLNGDDRFQMTLKELKHYFPSPARFFNQVNYCIAIAKESLAHLANGQHIKTLKVSNSYNACYEMETKEGARFRYGFSQGTLNGLFSGRSFYVWVQGAPGTNGQPGGLGGPGGRGGSPGVPGIIDVPKSYENTIVRTRRTGAFGRGGTPGDDGKNGVDGKQGTDFAIVDPYAGLWIPPANLLAKRRFSGNLTKVVVEDGKVYKNVARQVSTWHKPIQWIASSIMGTRDIPKDEQHLHVTLDDAAYCPHERCYITFVETLQVRDVLQVHPPPRKHAVLEHPPKAINNLISSKADLINKYQLFCKC